MAEDWRTAYGRVKMELDEYKETIVPALMDKIQELERRWIPVTERLPNNLETVLCYTNFEEVRIWQWNERWNSWIGLVADYGKNVVTHWMPLPEPPKEAELRGDTD